MPIEFLIGKREQISIGEETTYATAVTPDIALARDAAVDPKDAANWVEIRQAGADTVNIEQREISIRTREATLNFSPQDWRWLKFVLTDGSNGVADAGADPFTHTFTNKPSIASFTLERAMRKTGTDLVQTYAGMQCNSANISFDTGGGAGASLVKVAMELVGSTRTDGTTTSSVTIPTTRAFQFRNITLTIDSTEIVELMGGTILIENNLHDGRYANFDTQNQDKAESAVQRRNFTGTFRILVQDDFFASRWNTEDIIANTSIQLKRGTSDQLDLTFEDFRLTQDITPTNLDGINEVTLGWVAKDITAVATDSIATY